MSLKKFWNLSFYIAKTGFRTRNEGSYLGILWYLLNPIILFTLLYLVFSKFFGADIKYYALYLFLGLIIFNFFQYSILESIYAIRNNKHLLKSINLQRESFIVGGVLKFLFSNLIEFCVFIILMIILKVNIVYALIYPIVLIFLTTFILGVSLIISCISVYFLDFGNIWSYFSTILWFATPIFYSLETHPILSELSYLNPLYYYITLSREIIIYHQFPSLTIIAGVIVFSVISLILGLIIFNKFKEKFTEVM
jgi:ABC-type polysaccharide/polyol phosphate export permease